MGIDNLDNVEIESHETCELGKWIEKHAKKELSGSAHLAGLVKSHEEVHDSVKKVMELKKKDQPTKAWKAFEKLETVSEEVFKYLDKLEKSFNKKQREEEKEDQISAS